MKENNEIVHHNPDSCPVCGVGNWKHYKFAYNRVSEKTDELVRCFSCGLIRNGNLPDARFDSHLFSEKYFASKLALDQMDFRKNIMGHIRRYSKGTRLFEVGCGSGNFLMLAQNEGYIVSGIDIADKAVLAARGKGLDVQCQSIYEYESCDRLYDIIVMDNVLEHLENPVSALARIRDMIQKDGILIIRVPNEQCFARYIFDLLGNKMTGEYYQTFEHLYHYSPKTMEPLVKNTGMEILMSNSSLSLFGVLWRLGLMLPFRPVKSIVCLVLSLLEKCDIKLPFPIGNFVTVVARRSSAIQ